MPVDPVFRWSWYFHVPFSLNVKDQLSSFSKPLQASKIFVFSTGSEHFAMSDPGYTLCVGWTADAGQCFAVSLFVKVTNSPAFTVIVDGVNPEDVASTIFTVVVVLGVAVGITSVSVGVGGNMGVELVVVVAVWVGDGVGLDVVVGFCPPCVQPLTKTSAAISNIDRKILFMSIFSKVYINSF